MASKPERRIDGSRRRCLICGHPQAEHRTSERRCTVPKCVCETYKTPLPAEVPASTAVDG